MQRVAYIAAGNGIHYYTFMVRVGHRNIMPGEADEHHSPNSTGTPTADATSLGYQACTSYSRSGHLSAPEQLPWSGAGRRVGTWSSCRLAMALFYSEVTALGRGRRNFGPPGNCRSAGDLAGVGRRRIRPLSDGDAGSATRARCRQAERSPHRPAPRRVARSDGHQAPPAG